MRPAFVQKNAPDAVAQIKARLAHFDWTWWVHTHYKDSLRLMRELHDHRTTQTPISLA